MNRWLTSTRRAARGLALVAALLVFAATLAMLIPTSLEALPACGTHKKYYNNAAHTTQVGFRYYNCSGVLVTSWGSVTIYVVTNKYCCGIEP